MLHDIVKKGSVDRSVTVRIIDSTDGTPETGVVFNTSGIDLWYRRELSAVVSITEATLAALTTAHADGGFLTISHGYYRLDLPDAAYATGAQYFDFGGTVTGMVVIGGRVRLVDYDPEDTIRLGLTALPNAAANAAGGLPISAAGALALDTFLGRITGNVALASVLGALADAAADGAVTSTDTVVAYLKQLINTLEGTPGIPTWPASAAPGNAVSIAEAIRSIYDQIGVAGAGLTAADDAVLAQVALVKTQTDLIPSDPADASVVAGLIAGLDTKLDTIDNFLDSEITAIITALTGIVPVSGTIGATGNDTTHLHVALAYADDAINSMLLTIKDVSTGLFYSRWIEDFANTGDLATVATLPFTPEASVDLYWILPVRADVTGGAGLDAAGVRAAVGLASANLDTQLSDIETKVDDVETRIGTPSDLGGGATLAFNLSDIEAQTDDIGAAGAGLSAIPWNAAWDAEVQSEANDALVANNLDHLAAASVAGADVVDNSIIAKLVSKSATADWDSFVNTTDALEAIRDKETDIETDTGEIGTAGAGLTGLGGMSTTMKGQVEAEATDALNAYDGPTNAELATALGTADDAVLAAIAALNNLSQANIRTAVGLASANLDTQLTAIDDLLDTEVAAIKAKTDQLTFTAANKLDAAIKAIDNAIIVAATFGAGAIDAAALATDAGAEIADAVHDENVEGTHTLRELLRLFAAILAGKISGAATTTVTIRDIDDSKNRVVATVTADGDRTALTLDES